MGTNLTAFEREFRRVALVSLVLIAALLTIVPGSQAAKPGIPLEGLLYGNELYATNVSTVEVAVVTGNVSGATQFASSYLIGRQNDYYNEGFKAYITGVTTNITAGSLLDITDYVSATGTFTTTSADGDYAVGDRILIVFGNAMTIFGEQYYFAVTTTAAAPWVSVAAHEIATVTGLCTMIIVPECNVSLDDASNTSRISFGNETDVDAYITTTSVDAIDAGEIWISPDPARILVYGGTENQYFYVTTNGLDIGYTVATAVLTAGTMTFHVYWTPLEPGASVSAGAGGAL